MCVFSAQSAVDRSVDRIRRSFLNTLFQNTEAHFSLLSICNRRGVWFLFWRQGKLLLFVRPLKYNIYLPLVMSSQLVPRLVAIVAKFFMYERKVSNFIFKIFINHRHKKRPVIKWRNLNDVISFISICIKRSVLFLFRRLGKHLLIMWP